MAMGDVGLQLPTSVGVPLMSQTSTVSADSAALAPGANTLTST